MNVGKGKQEYLTHIDYTPRSNNVLTHLPSF